MSDPREPFSVEELRLGPIKEVAVFTSLPPEGVPVTDALGHQSLPFDQIKDLVADKPLVRAPFERPQEA